MQLKLFEWDQVEVGNGWARLGQLEFAPARRHFLRVLAAHPHHTAAQRGVAVADYWQQSLAELRSQPARLGCDRLWQCIKGFAFADSEAGGALRKGLLARLLLMMEEAGERFLAPDLCRGQIYLLMGDYVAAENELRALIETHPDQGIFYGYLADSLWLQGRREIAAAFYATALLQDPEQGAAYGRCHPQLRELIRLRGAGLAPVYGYFQGLLPLVDLAGEGESENRRTYALIQRAERARHRRDHAANISARGALQKSAPEVFREYLEFVGREG